MRKIKEYLKNEKVITYNIIVIVCLIVCIPLFTNQVSVMNDDGVQHISRLMGTFRAVLDGQPFFSIMSDLCNNFGYSWNIFYSPLTSFLPLVFRLFTSSFVLILKLFMFGVMVASGIFMFKFVNEVTKNTKISTLASIIYVLAPYHLTDMYIRVALAELTAFLFIPLIFLGLYNIINGDKKRDYYLTIGTAGLIITHNISVIIVTIFCFIYLLYNMKNLKDKGVLKKLLINFVLIISLTAFYTLPLLEHKNAIDYEVFVPDRMGSNEDLNVRKISAVQLFYTKDGIRVYEVGAVTIMGLLLLVISFKKIPKEYSKITFIFLMLGLICVLLTINQIPIRLPNFLNMLQFPWRLLTFSSFFFSMVVAISFGNIIKNFKFLDIIILSCIIILLLVPNINYMIRSENMIEEELLYEGIRLESNSGRIHAGMASLEYLPTKAFNNKEYIANREDIVYILLGEVEIYNEVKEKHKMEFDIYNSTQKSIIELPYIYYLGYKVTLETDDGNIVLDTFESENGFVAVELGNTKKAHISVKYTGTTIMKISYIITGLGVIFLVIYIVKNKRTIQKSIIS